MPTGRLQAPCQHKHFKVKDAILKSGEIVLREITCVEGHVWVEKETHGAVKVVKIKHG